MLGKRCKIFLIYLCIILVTLTSSSYLWGYRQDAHHRYCHSLTLLLFSRNLFHLHFGRRNCLISEMNFCIVSKEKCCLLISSLTYNTGFFSISWTIFRNRTTFCTVTKFTTNTTNHHFAIKASP